MLAQRVKKAVINYKESLSNGVNEQIFSQSPSTVATTESMVKRHAVGYSDNTGTKNVIVTKRPTIAEVQSQINDPRRNSNPNTACIKENNKRQTNEQPNTESAKRTKITVAESEITGRVHNPMPCSEILEHVRCPTACITVTQSEVNGHTSPRNTTGNMQGKSKEQRSGYPDNIKTTKWANTTKSETEQPLRNPKPSNTEEWEMKGPLRGPTACSPAIKNLHKVIRYSTTCAIPSTQPKIKIDLLDHCNNIETEKRAKLFVQEKSIEHSNRPTILKNGIKDESRYNKTRLNSEEIPMDWQSYGDHQTRPEKTPTKSEPDKALIKVNGKQTSSFIKLSSSRNLSNPYYRIRKASQRKSRPDNSHYCWKSGGQAVVRDQMGLHKHRIELGLKSLKFRAKMVAGDTNPGPTTSTTREVVPMELDSH